METSGALTVARSLAAATSQTPAKKALLPRRLQAPAKLWHFSSLHGSSRVPLSPLPLRLAPTRSLPAASRGWWPRAAGWPWAGRPQCGDRGAAPAPSTQPLPVQRLGQRGSQRKMSPWQPCGTTGLFFPPLGRGEGLETPAARPRHSPGSGSGAGTRGLRPRPPPETASARRLPLCCEGQSVPRLTGSPRRREPCAVGAAGVPAGTGNHRHC